MTARPNERVQAARLLHQVIDLKRTTDQAFAREEDSISPLGREMVYGSLRFYFSITTQLNTVLHKPIGHKDRILWALLIVGAYQLHHMRIPHHAAINETVNACGLLGKPWAKGLVNAVLRKVALEERPERTFDHPQWMLDLIAANFPEQAVDIFQANNRQAPMALRVNTARISPVAYQDKLNDAGIRACPGWLPETLVLDAPVSMEKLVGFESGLVSIQDAGAQFVPELIPLGATTRLLDACAAPGGKLFHLLERYPHIDATALDVSLSRLEQLDVQARRLGHDTFTTLRGDAGNLEWWEGDAFDVVLVDAPCSGSGTIRRHPDIKVLRSAEDVKKYAELQLKLIENLWRTLGSGGTLLYCTCSLFAEENDKVVNSFLQLSGGVPEVLEISLPVGQATQFGWQLLPTDDDPEKTTDGFYFSCLKKTP
ncbi:MAG: 16S rRNA (cytosine(967)-C(5))-methyltransferase RsmB [Gammaproteobacteria bacterium]|nr:16S rRNA (cytosine(967)-C(5))-methyltransferase RsmB [Gammaproteobacteria bacterium]